MADIGNALKTLRAAVADLTGQISALDSQIAGLFEQRTAIATAPVSKAEFLALLAKDMQVKAHRSRELLARRLASESKAYSYIKDAAEHGRLNIRYLAGGRVDFPVEVETESAYALLNDVILAGVAKIIEDAQWPEPGMPIPERERRLAELDAEIAKLTAERDVLASQLIEAGLAS